MKAWWKLMVELGTGTDTPMKPQVPVWAVNDVLAPDAIICGDCGTVTTWAARQITTRKGQQFSFSGTNCSMAPVCRMRAARARPIPAGRSWCSPGTGR